MVGVGRGVAEAILPGIKPPLLEDVDPPSGTILRIEGRFLVSIKTMPLAASAPLPKNAAPPVTLGI
jgi:hypothetical protein